MGRAVAARPRGCVIFPRRGRRVADTGRAEFAGDEQDADERIRAASRLAACRGQQGEECPVRRCRLADRPVRIVTLRRLEYRQVQRGRSLAPPAGRRAGSARMR